MRRIGPNLLLLLASLLVSLGLLETGLRLTTPYPVTTESNRVADPRLGYVMDVRYPGVDQRGFRNPPGALEAADLLFIGDSHTFGYNVDGPHSFPAVVAARTGRHVYNFGVGSYGIYQYAVLLEDAAGLPVRDVVLAVYLANDLSSPCRATRTEYWRHRAEVTGMRLPACGSDPTLPVRERLVRALQETATVQVVGSVLDSERFISARTHFLFDHGVHVNRARAGEHSEGASLADPDVRLNFANGRQFLLDARQRFDAAGIGFEVLFIPSKELVVREWLRRSGAPADAALDAVVANEAVLTAAVAAFLERSGISFFDALPVVTRGLADAVADGEPFYKPNDGHPLARGYAVYADAAIAALARLHPEERSGSENVRSAIDFERKVHPNSQ